MRAYFLFSFLFFASFLQGQNIRGTVTDQKGNLLPGCNVSLEGTYFGASTNVDGEFEFNAPMNDSATLKVQFVGYKAFKKRIYITNAMPAFTITLKEAFNKLNVVTVTAGMYGTGESVDAVVMNSLDVVTTAGALGDITGAMQTLPGTSTNGESGKLFVHGGSANETGTYIDGILVHAPYSSSAPNMAVRGRFNPFMFSGTAFSTGGYSAEYGQALSSVLILNTNEMPVEESVNISLMTIGADLAGTKMWKNGAITATANYMNLKPYMSVMPQNYTWNKQPEAFGGAINFRQKTAFNGLFKVYATIDQSNLSQQQNLLGTEQSTQNINLTNNNRFVNTNWKGLIAEKWMLKGGASFTYNENYYDLTHTTLTETLKGSHAKAMAIHEANEKFHLCFGTEYFYKNFAESYQVKNLAADSSAFYTDNKTAAFAEAKLYTSTKFVINAGLRAEYSSYLAQANVSPRISMAYKLSKNNQVSFAYGWFYQDPINTQLIAHNQISYEKATHYILSFDKQMNKRTLRAELYAKDYSNLVKYTNQHANAYTNNGHGYVYGVDLYFRDAKTIKNGDYWISYSYLNSERNYLNYPYAAKPSFTNAHTISVVYKHWIQKLRSQIGATLSLSSARPHNNPNQANFMADKLKPYSSLDVNWSFLYRDNIIFHAAFSNVLGANNIYGYNYTPTPNSNGTYGRTEILPSAKHFFFVGCFITLSKTGKENQLDKIN